MAGANNWLTVEDVTKSRQVIAQAKVLLCVLEVPRQAVLTGLRMANSLGGELLFSFSYLPSLSSTFPSFLP